MVSTGQDYAKIKYYLKVILNCYTNILLDFKVVLEWIYSVTFRAQVGCTDVCGQVHSPASLPLSPASAPPSSPVQSGWERGRGRHLVGFIRRRGGKTATISGENTAGKARRAGERLTGESLRRDVGVTCCGCRSESTGSGSVPGRGWRRLTLAGPAASPVVSQRFQVSDGHLLVFV